MFFPFFAVGIVCFESALFYLDNSANSFLIFQAKNGSLFNTCHLFIPTLLCSLVCSSFKSCSVTHISTILDVLILAANLRTRHQGVTESALPRTSCGGSQSITVPMHIESAPTPTALWPRFIRTDQLKLPSLFTR